MSNISSLRFQFVLVPLVVSNNIFSFQLAEDRAMLTLAEIVFQLLLCVFVVSFSLDRNLTFVFTIAFFCLSRQIFFPHLLYIIALV